jgi:hypothetical protein
MTASQCEFDWHIDMLSSSCDSEVEFDMHITIEEGPECTLNNTVGMHAQQHCLHARSLTRRTHHDSITV